MTAGMEKVAPWLIYPGVMILAFVQFALLQRQGASLIVSTYVPVLVTAALVTWLEAKFPHRLDWRPITGEVRTDLTFMVVVQLAFPPLIGFLFTYALIAPARALDLPIAASGRTRWPIWAAGGADGAGGGLPALLAAPRVARERRRSGGCIPCTIRSSSCIG